MDLQRILNPSVDVVDITCAFSALGLHQSLLDHGGTPSEPAPAPRPGVLDPNSAGNLSPTVRVANQLVIAKIENQVAAIAAEFLLQEEISLMIRTKKPAASCAQANFEYEAVQSLVRFPGRTAQETRRFSKLVKVSQTSYS